MLCSVTLSECLHDIVTDIIAEEGGVGLHALHLDADDEDIISQLMGD